MTGAGRPGDDELRRRLERAEQALLALTGTRRSAVTSSPLPVDDDAQLQRFCGMWCAAWDVNRMVAREIDRDRMVHRCCDALVSNGGYSHAWIALRDGGGRFSRTVGTLPEPQMERLARDMERGALPGCVERIMDGDSPAITADVDGACDGCPVVPSCRDHTGLCARLEHDGDVVGVLAAAAVDTSGPMEAQVVPFTEVAAQMGLALHDLSLREERERARQELVRSEQRLRSIVGVTSDALLEIDETGAICSWNHAAETLLGYSAREAVGRSVVELLAPDDPARAGWGEIECLRRSGLEPGDRRRIEVDVRASSGSSIPLEVAIAPLSRDRAWPLLVAARDLTETHRANAELRRARERADNIIESMLDAFFLLDADGTIRRVNPATTTMLGYEASDLVGRPFEMVLEREESPPDDGEGTLAERLTRRRLTGRHRRHFRTADGVVVPVLFSGAVLPGDDGEGDQVVCIARDIREVEALQNQLHAAQRMEAVGRLAGGVAHDFNNLLTVISNYATFLRDEFREGDPVWADIDAITDAARRATRLTAQLLAFSRRQTQTLEDVDLNEIVGSVTRMLQRMIGEDIDLELHLHDEPCIVRCDRGQMDQVLINLAVNARDAMPAGGLLTIETSHVDLDREYAAAKGVDIPPGAYAMLAVTDAGVGFDRATLEQAFEPFFTTKEPGKGTGLGLSTVYGIVKQHHGFVWIYSEPGHGATFKIYLPRLASPRLQAAEEVAPSATGGTETVLLVEDATDVRLLARRILAASGYHVIDAANGGEALLLAERHEGPIDLLLTDVVMPHMSGKELADRLRASRPSIEVLYMSGYTDNAIAHHGIVDPGVSLVQKPFSRADLQRAVRIALDRSHRRG